MKISTRFSVGVHILAMLDVCRDMACTSEFIAGSVNTNPVFVRRILGLLKKAGLVSTSLGRSGAHLLKRPEDITLLDVYRAVGANEGTVLDIHTDTNPQCPVGANIQASLGGTVHAVQMLLEAELSTRTIVDIVSGIRRRMK